MQSKKGFTLVELLAVVTILSILLILLLPNIDRLANTSKTTIRDSKIYTMVAAGEEYGNDYINHYKDCLGNKEENVLSDKCTIDITDLTSNDYLEGEDDAGNIMDPDTNKPFKGNILLCYNPLDVSIYGSYVEDEHYSCMDVDADSGNTLYIKPSESGYVGGDAIESKIIKSGTFSNFTCESSNANLATCSISADNKLLKIMPTTDRTRITDSEQVTITLHGYYSGGELSKKAYLTIYLTKLELHDENNKCIKTNTVEEINIVNTYGGSLSTSASPEDFIQSDIRGGTLYVTTNTKVGDTTINVTESNGHQSLNIPKRVYNLNIDNLPKNLVVGFKGRADLTFAGTGNITITSDNPDVVTFSSSKSIDADSITLNEGEETSFEIISKSIGTANITIKGEVCGLVENIKFTGSKLSLSSTSGEVYLGGQAKSIDIITDASQNLYCISTDSEAATCLIQGSQLFIRPGDKASDNVAIKVISSLGGEVTYNLKVLESNIDLYDEHDEKIENVCIPYESIDSHVDSLRIHGDNLGEISIDSISDDKILKASINKENNPNTIDLQARNLLESEAESPYKAGYNLGRTKINIKENNGNKIKSFYYNIYSMDISSETNAVFIGNYIDYNVKASATGNITASSSDTNVAIVEVLESSAYDSTPNSYNNTIVRIRGISEGKSDITIQGAYCGEETFTINVNKRDLYIDLEPGTYSTAIGGERLSCSASDPHVGCQVVLPEISTSDEFEIAGYSSIKDSAVSEYEPGSSVTITVENSGSTLYGNSVDKKAPVCHFTNYPENIVINKNKSVILECIDTGSGIVNNGELTLNDFNISDSKIATITNISKTPIENGYSYTLSIVSKSVGYFNISLKGEIIKDVFFNKNELVKTDSIISTEYQAIKNWHIGKNSLDDVIALLYNNKDIYTDSVEGPDTYSLRLYGKGEMLEFRSDDYLENPPWYEEYRSLITEVTINEGITNIGSHLMYNSFNLKIINLPEGIIRIGKRAFANTGVVLLDIPSTVIKIDDEAFYGDNKLVSLTLGNKITNIGSRAFYMHNLDSISIPDSVITIGEEAFFCDADSSKLSFLILGKNIKTIQAGAFANHKIITLTIPESVEYIGDKAFSQQDYFLEEERLEYIYFDTDYTLKYIGSEAFYNAKFSNIVLPYSVEYVGDHALGSLKESMTSFTLGSNVSHLGENFVFGEGLEEFIVDEANTNFFTIDGIIYTSDSETLVKCPDAYYKINTRLDIPEEVKIIAPGAFAGTQNNASDVQGLNIYIPEGIENLNLEYNFNYFTISSINLSNANYESIDGVLFSKDLKTIYKIPALYDVEEYEIPSSVETIGDYCAYANSRIKKITIPENVAIIESYAFQSDPEYSFSEIIINSTITPIYYISSFGVMVYDEADISTRTRTINVVDDNLYTSLLNDYEGADYTILVRKI